MQRINGFIAAPFTPFKQNGDLNIPVIEDYYNLLERNHIDGAFVCGSSGEGFSLTTHERKEVTEKWISVAPDHFKVVAHVGATGIGDSKELARHASQAGTWAIGVMNPVLFKPSDVNTLVEYCGEIAESAPDLPFYYYYIPGLTGDSLSLLSFLQKVSGTIPNFAGIKYTHENLYQLNQCMLVDDGKYEMLHGQDETLLLGLTLGIRGGVGGTYNHCFPIYRDIIDAYNKGEMAKAKSLQNRSQDFINVLQKYGGNLTAGKRIMKFLGIDCGPNRLPLRSLSRKKEEAMKEELNNIGFFDFCNK
jgi:N-acetylneuraminate lyase